jgi:hypothetical protein
MTRDQLKAELRRLTRGQAEIQDLGPGPLNVRYKTVTVGVVADGADFVATCQSVPGGSGIGAVAATKRAACPGAAMRAAMLECRGRLDRLGHAYGAASCDVDDVMPRQMDLEVER